MNTFFSAPANASYIRQSKLKVLLSTRLDIETLHPSKLTLAEENEQNMMSLLLTFVDFRIHL